MRFDFPTGVREGLRARDKLVNVQGGVAVKAQTKLCGKKPDDETQFNDGGESSVGLQMPALSVHA